MRAGDVVLPGFVDAHAHPVFGGNRVDEFEMRARGATYEEIAASGGGIRSTVRKTRGPQARTSCSRRRKTARELVPALRDDHDGSEIRLRFIDRRRAENSARHPATERRRRRWNSFRRFSARTPFRKNFAVRPSNMSRWSSTKCCRAWPKEQLAENCDIFCERGYFDLADREKILSAAQEHGLRLRMHVDQLRIPAAHCSRRELRAATADHLEQTNDGGDRGAGRGGRAAGACCPARFTRSAKTRYPKARAMIDAGLAVVLGDRFQSRLVADAFDPDGAVARGTQMKMTPAESVTAATINAAYSLGVATRSVRWKSGKRANSSIFDCADYREIAYWFGTLAGASVYIVAARARYARSYKFAHRRRTPVNVGTS